MKCVSVSCYPLKTGCTSLDNPDYLLVNKFWLGFRNVVVVFQTVATSPSFSDENYVMILFSEYPIRYPEYLICFDNSLKQIRHSSIPDASIRRNFWSALFFACFFSFDSSCLEGEFDSIWKTFRKMNTLKMNSTTCLYCVSLQQGTVRIIC